ncbi:MAG TPA: biotin--[acetyl-CoA-carboxylase] ligase [Azospirillaceae bacterium]|nr:biotin--[acetyl-CoA-carboxylase] ligase [Azospirillaceae bacterium]
MTMTAAAPALPPFYRLLALESAGSTNDVARDLGAQGAPEGTLVWARRQTAGRGRRGRTWESPEGNLYCSLLLRPDCRLAVASQLSFAAALAVADGIRKLLPGGREVRLKWPNDVLVDGAKVSGILLEAEGAVDGGPGFLVLGIGVNVGFAPDGTPYPATSLRACGFDGPLEDALAAVFGAFDHWYATWRTGGFLPLRTAWLAAAKGLGEGITVRLPAGTLEGTFSDLAEDGTLLLATADGGVHRIGAGDVFFRATGGPNGS